MFCFPPPERMYGKEEGRRIKATAIQACTSENEKEKGGRKEIRRGEKRKTGREEREREGKVEKKEKRKTLNTTGRAKR